MVSPDAGNWHEANLDLERPSAFQPKPCVLPVELEIEILKHAVHPGIILDTRIQPRLIAAYYEVVVNGGTKHFIRAAKKIRGRFRLICQRWNHIVLHLVPRWDVECEFPGTCIIDCISMTVPRIEANVVHLDHFTIDGDDLKLDHLQPITSIRIKSLDQAWVDSKSIQNILRHPSKLRTFHFESFIAQIRPSFIRYLPDSTPYLTTLSLKAADMVLAEKGITLPRVSTLFLSFMFMDRMEPMPLTWKFPRLKHISLERDDDRGSASAFVSNLVNRYRKQLVTLRLKSWKDYLDEWVPLSFWEDFPRLEVLATNFLEFRPGIFLLPAPGSHPLRHLIEMTPRYNVRRKQAEVSLKGLERMLPLVPQLQSVAFTEDWLAIKTQFSHGRGAMVARVAALCRTRGVKLMDTYGQEYPN